jgi:O-antigen ligase
MHWLLLGYMFLFIHRPFEVWQLLGDIHIERLYIGAALVALLLSPGKRWLSNGQHWANLAFAVAVLLCWIASPWADVGQHVVEDWLKILVFYGMLVVAVSDEKKLKFLVIGFVIIMFVYEAHSLLEFFRGRHVYRMGICRLMGVGKTLSDPNGFGNGVVYSLPVVAAVWSSKPARWLKVLLASQVLLSAVCIVLTGSRGSFLGLLLWSGVVVVQSKYRWSLLALAFVAAPILWACLPPDKQARFTTIIDSSTGPANAQESAEGRLHGLENGWRVFSQSPMTGIGPGAWKPATNSKIESHNVYAQMLGETGLFGTVTFVVLLYFLFRNIWTVRSIYASHPRWERDFTYHMAGGLCFSLILMLLEGLGSHNLYRFNWLWYGGFLVIARHCVEQRQHRERNQFPPRKGVPLGHRSLVLRGPSRPRSALGRMGT